MGVHLPAYQRPLQGLRRHDSTNSGTVVTMLILLDKLLAAEVPALTESMSSADVALLVVEHVPDILEADLRPIDLLIALSSGHMLWDMFQAPPIEQVKGFVRHDPRYSHIRDSIIEFHMYLRSISHSAMDTSQLADKFLELFELHTAEDGLDWAITFIYLYGTVLQPQCMDAKVLGIPR